LALAQKESFEIKTLIDDEKVATFRQLEWNPNSQLLLAYEINPKAMLPDYNAGLAPNFTK